MSQSSPLWGAYLEMILGDGDTRKRQQWIFAPPVPATVAPEGMRPVDHVVYWYRRQNNPEHKSVWVATHVSTPQKHQDLLASIRDAEAKKWVANPLVTCEVHPLEMKEIALGGWKTPYRIINRVTRVAKHKYNYTI